MAIVTKIKYQNKKDHHPSAMKGAIRYCLQPSKTKIGEKVFAVSSLNCTPEIAYSEFMANKSAWNKTDGLCFKHYVQSFHPNENIAPAQANKIGLEFAEKAWGEYEVLVATHVDKEHIHNHFIIDTVNIHTGKKLHEDIHNIENLRNISDMICAENGLSVLSPYKKNSNAKSINSREYRAGAKGDSWKFRLRNVINNTMKIAANPEEFIEIMQHFGYGVRWEDNRKNLTYTCYKERKHKDGNYKKCNDDKLSDEKYLKGNIENEFKIRTKKQCYGSAYEAEREQSDRGANQGTPDIHGNRGYADSNKFSAEETAFGNHGSDESREPENDNPDRGNSETGWERERDIFFKNRQSDEQTHGSGTNTEGQNDSHDNLHDNSGGDFWFDGLRALSFSLSSGDDPNEDPEERKRRIDAERAAANYEAFLKIVEKSFNYYTEKKQQNEEDDEHDFTMQM